MNGDMRFAVRRGHDRRMWRVLTGRGCAALVACACAALWCAVPLAGRAAGPRGGQPPAKPSAPATAGPASPQAASPEGLLLQGGRVLDVVAGRYLDVAAVLVEGDRIVALFKEVPPNPPPRTRVVDVSGLTLVPGLGDMHAVTAPTAEVDADYFYALALAHGVTMSRVIGAPLPWAASQRQRIAEGATLAPRAWISGPTIDAPPVFGLYARGVADAEAARREVRAQIAAGVDWISAGGGVTEAILRALVGEVSPGESRGAAGEATSGGDRRISRAGAVSPSGRGEAPNEPAAAARRSPRVAATAGAVPMLVLADAGVASIESLGMPVQTRADYETALAGRAFPSGSPEAARAFVWARVEPADLKALATALVRNGTVLVPLLAGGFGAARLGALEDDPGVALLPAARRERLIAAHGAGADQAERERHLAAFAVQARFVAGVVRAKGRIVTGSDWNGTGYGVPGAAIHHELRLLVEAGLTPAEAIRAATVNCAALVGAGESLGQIKQGFGADLIAVDGDPLARIEDLARIRFVIRGGELLKPDALAAQAKRGLSPRDRR